jgi:hypothetical protein
MPELGKPETAGTVQTQKTKSPHVNGIDAVAAGTADGLRLALNVAAMLIVFIAFVAMFDALLGFISKDLSLQKVFGYLFSPAAFLMGVEGDDISKVGSLLGAKLAINEHYAYLVMKGWKQTAGYMTDRSYLLAAFALTGFANFASVGIQLGGIGAMAPERRSDLAKLGLRALFVGFTATLLNAAIAGILLRTLAELVGTCELLNPVGHQTAHREIANCRRLLLHDWHVCFDAVCAQALNALDVFGRATLHHVGHTHEITEPVRESVRELQFQNHEILETQHRILHRSLDG